MRKEDRKRREEERLEDTERRKRIGQNGKRASLSLGSNGCTAATGARATTILGAHPPNPADLKKREKVM